MRSRKGACALLTLALTVPVLAQSDQTSAPAAAGMAHHQHALGARRVSLRNQQPPCWKQAGISPETVNERWKIEDEDRVKTRGICSEAALSPEQKKEKIKQADKVRDAEIAKLISAKQLEAYNACKAERDQNRPKMTAVELGPCGGVIPPATNSAPHSHGNSTSPSGQ